LLFNSLEFVTFFALVFTAYWSVVRFGWPALAIVAAGFLVFSGWVFEFDTWQFVLLTGIVVAIHQGMVRWGKPALGVLLGASLLFYACWNPLYLGLIVASSFVDFCVGGQLFRTSNKRRRTQLLLVSMIYNLGILAVFKYFNFFMDSVAWVDTWMMARGWIDGPALSMGRLQLLLPVGISFFTFQSMSYTIDIYRRELEPVGHGEGTPWYHPAHFGRYLLFVSFFPQLVAGPIVRARDLLPQLRDRPPLTDVMAGRGLYLVLLGLFKKIVIADYLALNLVDRTFELTGNYSSFEVLVGVYGYAFQIYCDFSGYSDIAIGTALLLGFTFPDNFNAPYIARNLQDFWRRWHISLSTWLRDYLYIALGGSRNGAYKTYRNLMLTMLLGGLWHGAGWNFIIWGLLHGVALAVLRAWQRARKHVGKGALFGGPAGRALAALITFHYVCFAWIFFRAKSFEQTETVLAKLSELTFATTNLNWQIAAVLGVAAATHLVPKRAFEAVVSAFIALPAVIQAALAVGAGLAFKQVISADAVPFIYFQF
jgi:alginate O-acetyltransferase complex protein AlgI